MAKRRPDLAGTLVTQEDRAPYAARMKELRETNGRTAKECADALGVVQSTYTDMENNNQLFRRRDLVTLASLYFPNVTTRTAWKRAFGEVAPQGA